MSTDLKADLLEALEHADSFAFALTTKRRDELRARLQSATITEPPPPDPCVVECGEFKAWKPHDSRFLRISGKRSHTYNKEPEGVPHILLNRGDAAALIPALQAFIGDVREGSGQ